MASEERGGKPPKASVKKVRLPGLGARMAEALERANLKNVDVAIELNCDGATVSNYLNGKREATPHVVAVVARMAGVTTDELLGFGDKRSRYDAVLIYLQATRAIEEIAASLALALGKMHEAEGIAKSERVPPFRAPAPLEEPELVGAGR